MRDCRQVLMTTVSVIDSDGTEKWELLVKKQKNTLPLE